MLKCSILAEAEMGRDSVFFKGLSLGAEPCQLSIWASQIELFFFFSGGGGGAQITHKSWWGLTWEDWEMGVIRVYDVKFPINQ